MKLIFLDFDGVLNSLRYMRETRQIGDLCTLYDLDPVAGARIKRLMDETGAKIIVSSTWRIGRTLSELQVILGAFGIHADDVLGATPSGVTSSPTGNILLSYERGNEIQEWMDNWKGVPIESFVIIDDSNDMAHLLPKLVRTSWETGILDEHVEKAKEMLNSRPRSMPCKVCEDWEDYCFTCKERIKEVVNTFWWD